MKENRYYRRWGTTELPVSSLLVDAEVSMEHFCHWHPEMEFVLITKGSVEHRFGKETITLQAGDFVIVLPEEIHGVESHSADACLRRLIFKTNAISMSPTHYFQKNFVTPLTENRLKLPRLIQPGHPIYENITMQMMELENCKTYEPDYQNKRFGILMAICVALFPYCHADETRLTVPDPGNRAVRLTMQYINSYYRKKLDLQTLADNVHLHPNYLCALFKAYTGETIFQHLTRMRVESATYFLQEEDLPMSRVAELSGFNTESLFYQKFKQVMGITPNAYKKQYRKSQTE